ncbi:uncharacterized protein A4U43_C05F25070 [Asparagus officinalis]|uniref:DUF761 domain-containing protein n=1 Tax=Asparagus officinalis TaxID=4686 RepID=A0A5P1EUH0_ASPOF|nr:uncharacterized protein LOC109843207 [Asparagus officinalis]ONK69632.1 uncharacterized protein A4U43_C05F25070 [Asparagus officinalis]
MTTKKSPLFTKLHRAIRKVKFLLSFNATKWIFSSILGSPSDKKHRRRLSLRSQPSGLLDCTSNDEFFEASGSPFVLSRSTSSVTDRSRSTSPASEVSRSTSSASSTDDIDQRAEEFIRNFYRHIQMERQVSLELRYCKGKELERTRS